jgi:hypothetical protein
MLEHERGGEDCGMEGWGWDVGKENWLPGAAILIELMTIITFLLLGFWRLPDEAD